MNDSHDGTTQPAVHKVGDIITLKSGQQIRVTAIQPGGKYTGVPAQ